MKPLDPESRKFLERAHQADMPASGAQERLWRSLEARFDLPLPPSAQAASQALGGSVAPAAVAAGGGSSALIGAAAALVMSAAGVVWYASPEDSATERLPPSTADQRPLAPSAPEVAPAVPDPPTPNLSVVPVVKRKSAAPSTLDEESKLLAAAQNFLRSDAPAQALARLEQHRRRFPHGALAQEREAARVAALCALGRTSEADRAANRFRTGWPDSALEPHCSEDASR